MLELRRALRTHAFDVIVCHVPLHPLRLRDPVVPAYEMVIRTRAAPLVALDLNDRIPLTRTALRLLDRCQVYFKRELPIHRATLLTNPSARQKDVLARNLPKIKPVSLGLAPWRIADLPDPLPEKSTDVFYSGTFSPEIRARGAALLERLAQEGFRVDLSRERLGREEYLRRTAQAFLVWSPEGLGWQCFRHLEASAAASVPVMNEPTIEQIDPLRAGEHCLYYKPEGDDLLRVIRGALSDKERLRHMSQAARRHVLTHHMHADSVAYILRTAASLPIALDPRGSMASSRR